MVAFVIALVATALVGWWLTSRAIARSYARAQVELLQLARSEAEAMVRAAKADGVAHRTAMEATAQTEGMETRRTAELAFEQAHQALDTRAAALNQAAFGLAEQDDALAQRQTMLDEAYKLAQALRDRADGVRRDAERRQASLAGELERRASVSAKSLIDTWQRRFLDEAQARAAELVRHAEQSAADPQHDRMAQRLLEISAGRYQNHFLTERAVSTLRCGKSIIDVLLADGEAVYRALQEASGITLHINDERDALRMEGIDGVGREVVRRALARLEKKTEAAGDAQRDPAGWVLRAKDAVNSDIRVLGKKAFAVLGVGKAPQEIVELVGALNYRTSYTQNQWLHAVEASFLAGMMAAEMGLDVVLAKRATLMHDIGKALTHKIDGSHAVIGADIARRLGESEVVANAIGSHHNDEPQNSVYAYLVAAADAMSGARPGARRELAEGFSAKVEDLERIGSQRRGVVHAHAVHGGRELRVYVNERHIDDAAVVAMSGDIAAQISDEMTFPGQIKVTVIRAFEAVASAN